ncbi:MAG: hypothetical protein AMXMBFR22_13590 [Phycisphaerae bacterium]
MRRPDRPGILPHDAAHPECAAGKTDKMDPRIKPPTDQPAIKTVMMPRDTNGEGTIFGGVILSLMDQAAYVEACRQAYHRYVTVSFHKVEFHKPVFVGDIVTLTARTVRIGRSSIQIHVAVWAQRRSEPDVIIQVTEGEVVFVAVSADGNPIPVFPE